MNSNIRVYPEYKKEIDYSSTIIHDLKSPTQAQINALDLLLKGQFGKLTSDQLEVVENILDSCYYMRDLISNLLFGKRFTAQDLKYEDFLFSDLAKNCASELYYFSYKKNQQIKILFDPKIKEKLIKADKIFLKRVICNLLTNAVNYSYENSEIEMKIKQSDLETTCIIKSYGPLISKDLLKNIFKFGVYGRKSTGNGIGLSVVKQIIDLHKGLVQAKTKEPDCNIFEFVIPNNR